MKFDFDSLELSDNPTTDSLTKLIGAELVARLSDDLGGLAMSIPYTPGENSPITASIGLDAALKISAVYGGLVFKVPLNPGIEMKVLKMLEEGANKNQIARALKISRTRIDRIAARDANTNQFDLFNK